MGIANTTIWTYDPISELYTQPQVFQNEAEVNIKEPLLGREDFLTERRIQESNRFNLIVSSTPGGGFSPVDGTLSPPGAINLFSAHEPVNGFFAQYWDIEIVDNRRGITDFEGVLREDYREERLVGNHINTSSGAAHSVTSIPGINFGEPEIIAEGTVIRGSFYNDQSAFYAIVEGKTLDGDLFAVEIYDDFV